MALNLNTTGNNNTANGNYALGANTTGSNNTAIGYGADVASGNLTNATALGAYASVNANNKIQLGDGNVTNVQLGTGTKVTLETGLVKITGGTPGTGKVLTSDASGLASWATPNSLVTHTIGESFGGGIVFYVTTDGLHGLIAETIDSPLDWWFYAQDNISNPDNHSTLGKLFTDWRLPTRYEINLLVNYGGLTEGVRYWASTENGQSAYLFSYAPNFIPGFTHGGDFVTKTNNYSARAIRSF